MLLSGIIGLLKILDNIVGIQSTVICSKMTSKSIVVLGYQIPSATDPWNLLNLHSSEQTDTSNGTMEDLLNDAPSVIPY